MEKPYTLVIFTENKIGILNRVTSLLTQRHINIESITASESEFNDIHRLTIVVHVDDDKVQKVVKQIEKQVEVLKSYCFTDENTVYAEIALYKLDLSIIADKEKLEAILDKFDLRKTAQAGDYLIVEKTGSKEITNQVFEALKPFGLYGFVRSGRVSLSRTAGTFSDHLEQFESHSKEIITKYN
ncbi:MAG: acetolactate synthase small subunit [Cyclobacteriaceae bacterium]